MKNLTNRRIAVLIYLAGILMALACPAQAYTRMGTNVRWPTSRMPVPFYINRDGASDIPNGSEFLAIQRAFETWQKVSTASISFSYLGTTDVSSAGRDGVNIVSFADKEFLFSSGAIAVTLVGWNATGAIQEADIVFNPEMTFSTSGASDAFDIQSVATHEIGHFLGLDHSAIVSATLNPYGTWGSTWQRVLRSDDLLGISSIYPATGHLDSRGTVTGHVTSNGSSLKGAHVVILDSTGNALASALSDSKGAYQIQGLPAGDYYLYAEPLDGPVTEDNFYNGQNGNLATDFMTTFYGDVTASASAKKVTVNAGATVSGLDIKAASSSSVPLNIISPDLGILEFQGDQSHFFFFGSGFVEGMLFRCFDPHITFDTPSIYADTDNTLGQVDITVGQAAITGQKSFFVEQAGALAALSGGLMVTPAWPAISGISPDSGPVEGGTAITITGTNFTSGMDVTLGGIPLQSLTVLSDAQMQALTPANKGGPNNLQVVSTNGVNAVLEGGFAYQGPPVTITSISPASGPPGTLVTITGINFDGKARNNSVSFFDEILAEVLSASPNQLQVVVPYGTISGPVTVNVFGQKATSGVFTVILPPPTPNRGSVQFQFIDTSTNSGGVQLPFPPASQGFNKKVVQTTLPFDFSLFGTTFASGSTISVTNNGWLSLQDSVGKVAEWENPPLPAALVRRPDGTIGSIPGSLIAPFFDDLTQDLPDSGVFTRVLGAAPNRQFVIEWKHSRRIDALGYPIDGHLTFQAVLYESSNDIAFQYLTLQGDGALGDSATVGLQNAQRDRAAEYSYDEPLIAEQGVILFKFNPLDGTYKILDNQHQFLPFLIDTADFRTNLGIANPSGNPADVTLELFDETGMFLGFISDAIPPFGLHQYNHVVRTLLGTDPTTSSDQQGTLRVTSNQSVKAYSTQIENQSNDPSLLISEPMGGTDYLIPSTTSVNQFRSSLVIQNTSDALTSVELRQRNTSGEIVGEMAVPLSPFGFYAIDDLHAAMGISGVYGPLEIHSFDQTPKIVASRVYSIQKGTSGSFEGIDLSNSSANGILPLTLENAAFRTNVGIDNLGDGEASVQVRFVAASGTALATQMVRIPPHGLFQQNVFQLFGSAPNLLNVPGYLLLNSDQPISGFTSLIDNNSDDPSFAQFLANGASRLLVPSSTNVGAFRSDLAVINLSTTQPAPIQITVRDVNGKILCQDRSQLIPPGGFYKVDDVLTKLEISNNYGPLMIESLGGQPLAAVSRVYDPTHHTSSFFRAIPY